MRHILPGDYYPGEGFGGYPGLTLFSNNPDLSPLASIEVHIKDAFGHKFVVTNVRQEQAAYSRSLIPARMLSACPATRKLWRETQRPRGVKGIQNRRTRVTKTTTTMLHCFRDRGLCNS